MDRLGVRQVPEGSGEQRQMEKTDCEVICGALATPTVKKYSLCKREGEESGVQRSVAVTAC